MNKKFPALLIAGIAAYAYYMYSKMDANAKKDLVNNIKGKGKQLFKDYLPDDLKQKFDNLLG
ncbi:MAG: hypothetical protein ABJB05_06060 [Parafilimonas sp.]